MSEQLDSNRSWSLAYSFSSLRRQPLKNIGIVIFLAFNIAIPTTVFAWTDTSIYLAVEDHFSANAYQMLAKTNLRSDYTILQSLEERSDLYDTIEAIDYFPSTVGILTNSNTLLWSTYFQNSPMPASGINDFRLIPVTNEIIDRIMGEFVWNGESRLESGQILISERLVYHVWRTHEILLEPGMKLDFDILPDMPTTRNGNPILAYRWNVDIISKANYTIAGIYKLKTLSTLLAQAFPSILRPDPWPEHINDMESVLGLEDSVMILQDEIDPQDMDVMSREGYFEPVTLFRGDISRLVDLGPKNIEDNLLEVKVQIEDAVPRVFLIGASTLSEIAVMVEAFEQGQILTLVALPIMFLSIFVTIYTTESSLSHRKLEITVLRAKGASYNQVITSIMWESMLLSLSGLVLGFIFTALMAPVIGSSTGLFSINIIEFFRFFHSLRIPYLSFAIAVILSLFLPGLYLYQIERRINVFEIGNPDKNDDEERIKESYLPHYIIILLGIIIFTLIAPWVLHLLDVSSAIGLLLVTASLILGSFFGSRVIQLGISKVYAKIGFKLGERALYVHQSLRRRRGKFIPLMIILTLSLTSSTMMLIESSSFAETIHNDIVYSFGGDLRAEAYVPYPFSIIDNLEEKDNINLVTPVTKHLVTYEGNRLFMIGVDAEKYLQIGTFTADTFPESSATEILDALEDTPYGVILPKYYADLLSKDVGDSILVRVTNVFPILLTIVGVMESAPGFGDACLHDSYQDTIVSNLGFQIPQDGFLLVNYEMVSSFLSTYETDLFLMDVDIDDGFVDLYDEILSEYRFDLLTPHWNLLPDRERLIVADDSVFYSRQPPIYFEIERFTGGLQGIALVCTLACLVMAISSIGLFFGAAINDRRSEYAILRAVGAKQEDVYAIVVNEFAGLVITTLFVSIGLGVIFGYAATYLILSLSPFTPILSETISLPLYGSLLVFGTEFVSLLLACYFPARKAASMNILEDLRNL
ncbi:MAG: FtsX-like permease family protein [Candidatus Thorarchaeota archaeon]